MDWQGSNILKGFFKDFILSKILPLKVKIVLAAISALLIRSFLGP
jgi:hypothetical protein